MKVSMALIRHGVMLVASGIALAAEIPRGAVLLRMTNAVSTKTAREGDHVYLTTASPIAAGGQIVAPVGSYVQGVVSHVRQSGRVSGRAELSIRLETLTLPAGKVFKIAPRLSSVDDNDTSQKVDSRENDIKQGSSHGRDAAWIAIIAGHGAAIGGIADRSWKGAGIGAGAGGAVGLATVLLTRGHEVELKHGATLDVVFDRAVTLE